MGGIMGVGTKLMAAGLGMDQMQGVTRELHRLRSREGGRRHCRRDRRIDPRPRPVRLMRLRSDDLPISEISGIGPDVADRLKSVGIRTTTRLLDAAKGPKERKRLAEKTGLDEKRILSWANTADRMRIKGVGADYAGLLQAAGVDTVKELKYRNPAKLARAMAEANAKRKLARVLPSDRAVERWIDQAKRLVLKITY